MAKTAQNLVLRDQTSRTVNRMKVVYLGQGSLLTVSHRRGGMRYGRSDICDVPPGTYAQRAFAAIG